MAEVGSFLAREKMAIKSQVHIYFFFHDKCVTFACNCKFANLAQYRVAEVVRSQEGPPPKSPNTYYFGEFVLSDLRPNVVINAKDFISQQPILLEILLQLLEEMVAGWSITQCTDTQL